MTLEQLEEIVGKCSFPSMTLRAQRLGSFLCIYGTYEDAWTVTGNTERQVTRVWLVEPGATVGDVVGTCFKLCLTSMEQRTRGSFKYREEPVYYSHHDPDILVALCKAEKELANANQHRDQDPRHSRSASVNV